MVTFDPVRANKNKKYISSELFDPGVRSAASPKVIKPSLSPNRRRPKNFIAMNKHAYSKGTNSLLSAGTAESQQRSDSNDTAVARAVVPRHLQKDKLEAKRGEVLPPIEGRHKVAKSQDVSVRGDEAHSHSDR